MSRVVIRNLVKRYGPVAAVSDIDIAEGEFIALLGPSGCGKTTTLRCIAGLEEVSDGEIIMGDRLVSSKTESVPPEKREIGMVFQSYAIWPHMTVAENVAFGLGMKGLAKSEVADRVQTALSLVGLAPYGSRGASQLSGGQQQRVALARAIVLEPGVLLFDEPLSNLDAKLREKMRFELRELQTRLGTTSIYVTHDQQEAMVIADRVVLMNEGRIDQIGAPTALYSRPVSRFGAEFIGLANIFRGQVVGTEGGTQVRISDDVVLHSLDCGFAIGQSVDAVCRPENLLVSLQVLHGPNSFHTTIASSYFLGNIADVTMQAAGVELRCQLSPPRPWGVGKEIWVQVPPECLVLLSADNAG